MIFADHDVNPNTNFDNLEACYAVIKELFPDAVIISGVTIIGRNNNIGSVYPNPPFKNNTVDWFYNVNNFIQVADLPKTVIASHGLIHLDHSRIHSDAQKMSILSSCSMLGTKIFIPPFNKFNEDTLQICEDNKIEILLTSHGWKSLEHNAFDVNHSKYYWHSWRTSPKELRGMLNAGITAKNS